jgi:hypothetical protein
VLLSGSDGFGDAVDGLELGFAPRAWPLTRMEKTSRRPLVGASGQTPLSALFFVIRASS